MDTVPGRRIASALIVSILIGSALSTFAAGLAPPEGGLAQESAAPPPTGSLRERLLSYRGESGEARFRAEALAYAAPESGPSGSAGLVAIGAQPAPGVAKTSTLVAPATLTPSASPELRALSSHAITKGDVRVLILRVQFQVDDDPETTGDGLFYEGDGYAAHVVKHYVKYMQEVSAGQLRIKATLSHVYTLPQTMGFYGGPYAANDVLLLLDAVAAADQDVDFSAYDQVLLFHAGAGEESDSAQDSPGDIWSSYLPPELVAHWAPDGIPTNDGVRIRETVLIPETENQDEQWGQGTLGVFVHEYGHLLGLPDLYDTTHATQGGVGHWSLMASGSWVGDGYHPSHPGAWDKIRMGWITPTVIKTGTKAKPMKLAAIEAPKGQVLKFFADGVDGARKPTEYFLLENRQRIGADEYLPGTGLVLWHVDESIGTDNDYWIHPLVRVVSADGRMDLVWNDGNPGDETDPWYDSAAGIADLQSYSGRPVGLSVTDIGPSGDVMSFKLTVQKMAWADASVPAILDNEEWRVHVMPGHPGGHGHVFLGVSDDLEVASVVARLLGTEVPLKRNAYYEMPLSGEEEEPAEPEGGDVTSQSMKESGEEDNAIPGFSVWEGTFPMPKDVKDGLYEATILVSDGRNKATRVHKFEVDTSVPDIRAAEVLGGRFLGVDDPFTIRIDFGDSPGIDGATLHLGDAMLPLALEAESPWWTSGEITFSGLQNDVPDLQPGTHTVFLEVNDGPGTFSPWYTLGSMTFGLEATREAFPYPSLDVFPLRNEFPGPGDELEFTFSAYDLNGDAEISVHHSGEPVEIDSDTYPGFHRALLKAPEEAGCYPVDVSITGDDGVGIEPFPGEYCVDGQPPVISDVAFPRGLAYDGNDHVPVTFNVTDDLAEALGDPLMMDVHVRAGHLTVPAHYVWPEGTQAPPEDEEEPAEEGGEPEPASVRAASHDVPRDYGFWAARILLPPQGSPVKLVISAVDASGKKTEFAKELTLRETGRLAGSVLWKENAVGNAELQLKAPDGATHFVWTLPDGTFQKLLPAGKWSLVGMTQPHFGLKSPVDFTISKSKPALLKIEAVPLLGIAEIVPPAKGIDTIRLDFFPMDAPGEPEPMGEHAEGEEELEDAPEEGSGAESWCELYVPDRYLDCRGEHLHGGVVGFPHLLVSTGTYQVVAGAGPDYKPWESPQPLEFKPGAPVKIAPTFVPRFGALVVKLANKDVPYAHLEIEGEDGSSGWCDLDFTVESGYCEGLGEWIDFNPFGGKGPTERVVKLPDGKYDLRLSAGEDFLPFEKSGVPVPGGKSAPLPVALKPRFAILHLPVMNKDVDAFSVALLDKGGEEVTSCEVTLFDAILECTESDAAHGWGDPFPSIRVTDGKYKLVASAPDMVDFAKDVTAVGGKNQKVPITFKSTKGILSLSFANFDVRSLGVELVSGETTITCTVHRDGDESECDSEDVSKTFFDEKGAWNARLLAGKYDVRVYELVDEGVGEWGDFKKTKVAVTAGKATKLAVKLVPRFGWLYFPVSNPDVDAFTATFTNADGEEVTCSVAFSEGSLDCGGFEVPEGPFPTVKLETGKWDLSADAGEDFQPFTKSKLAMVGGKLLKTPIAFKGTKGVLLLAVGPEGVTDYTVEITGADLQKNEITSSCTLSPDAWECDGDGVALATPGMVRLPGGKYSVSLVAEGWIPSPFSKTGVAVAAGKTTKLPVALKPSFAVLATAPTNVGLEAYRFTVMDADGNEIGACDVVKGDDEASSCEGIEMLKAGAYTLDAGKYTVVFQAAGAGDVTLSATLKEGEVVALKPTFKPNVVEVTVKQGPAAIKTGSIVLRDADGNDLATLDVNPRGKTVFVFVPAEAILAVYLDADSEEIGTTEFEIVPGGKATVALQL